MSFRHAVVWPGDDALDTVMQFEESDLSDRQKAALRLASAFLEVPSRLTPEAREEALRHFSPQEIAGLLLKLMSFTWNKPRAALGIDRPVDDEKLTLLDYGAAEDFKPDSQKTD